MKEFLNKRKKNILKIVAMLIILIIFSAISLLILQAFGIVYYEDGMKLNIQLFYQFTNSWYGAIIILLIQVAITTLTCFIPGASMAFIILLQTLFTNQIQAFIVAFLGVMLSSTIMYLIGRFGGHTLCEKIIGKEDSNKASELLNNRGVVYFPLMMLFPMFPDDALVMIAGTLKMSLKWFIPSIVIGRGIGVITVIFHFVC